MSNTVYTLKHFDRPLLDFEFLSQNGPEGECVIHHIYEENRHLLPPVFPYNGKALYKKLRGRVVSLNRREDDNFWKDCGIEMNNTEALIRTGHAASLNDCYWVSVKDSGELFKDFNVYEHISPKNPALAPFFDYDNRLGLRRYKGKLFFYKTDLKDMCSELFSVALADKMGLDYCDYEPVLYKNTLCVRCAMFSDLDHSFMKINRLLRFHSMKQITDFLGLLGEDYVNAYHDMLVFDCLIVNNDRHSGNYGLIVDSRTLTPQRFTPLFDHGRAFFSLGGEFDGEKMAELADSAESFYGVPFNEIAQKYIADRHREQLKKIKDFRLPAKYAKYFPGDRVKSIEEFINLRSEKLLTF